jgi:uncharacterized protein YndB with AHSA1/START domain
MSEPNAENVVTKSIVVPLSVERAFRLWTEQIQRWWPTGHSISGDPRTQVFIEGKAGGRFFERTADGREYDWGAVGVWEPPHRLVFAWYLGSNQALPSRVQVQFVALTEGETRVEIEHRGPELIGELWWQRRAAYRASWDHILPNFAALATSDQT